MSNEEKKYSIIGKVEIGTDEYRDLIESVAEANKRAERNYDDYQKKYNEVQNLTKEVEALKPYKEFVLSKYVDAFKLWKLEQMESDKE